LNNGPGILNKFSHFGLGQKNFSGGMNLKDNDPVASILEFLRIEKKCYDEVLHLMGEQLQAIEQEDEKKLDAVIEKKADIIQTARNNESQLKTAVSKLSASGLTEVKNKSGELKLEIESVLAHIIEAENKCQVELKARKFLAHDKIFDIKQNRNLLKGYGTKQRIKPKISKSV
jgi:hypothetical protein